jgi:heterodisulfide reductase subunit D
MNGNEKVLNIKDIVRQTKVQYCLDCGKCTSVCPVSRYDPQFSPRLIVQNALRNIDSINSDNNIWSCVGCNMCSIRCNYNVNYVEFIRFLRMQSRNNGTELIYSHHEIPEAFMHLMSNTAIEQNRMNWIPGDIELDKTSETAFFVGCAPYFDIIFKDLGVNTTKSSIGAMRLLNSVDVHYNLLDNERCCGHDLLLAGDLQGFMNLGRSNIKELNEHGIKRVITSCPECYYTLKVDYLKYFEDWNIEVVYLSELIKTSSNLSNSSHDPNNKRRITYHDSCRLGRYFKTYDSPRELLLSSGKYELIEMENSKENSLCCGANPWMFCGSVNRQMQDERLEQASRTDASYLVTSCPKCQIHLKCAQVASHSKGSDIEIIDIYDLTSRNLAQKEHD